MMVFGGRMKDAGPADLPGSTVATGAALGAAASGPVGAAGGVVVEGGKSVVSATMPSSVAMLVIVLGVFMIYLGATGGKSLQFTNTAGVSVPGLQGVIGPASPTQTST